MILHFQSEDDANRLLDHFCIDAQPRFDTLLGWVAVLPNGKFLECDDEGEILLEKENDAR